MCYTNQKWSRTLVSMEMNTQGAPKRSVAKTPGCASFEHNHACIIIIQISPFTVTVAIVCMRNSIHWHLDYVVHVYMCIYSFVQLCSAVFTVHAWTMFRSYLWSATRLSPIYRGHRMPTIREIIFERESTPRIPAQLALAGTSLCYFSRTCHW